MWGVVLLMLVVVRKKPPGLPMSERRVMDAMAVGWFSGCGVVGDGLSVEEGSDHARFDNQIQKSPFKGSKSL